jgi:hypothetical protein
VMKRDGSLERFDKSKLAAALWKSMRGTTGRFVDARELALAIELYIQRLRWPLVRSAALFEMALKVLRRVRLARAARSMERHRTARAQRRGDLQVDHGDGKVTLWDKTWLCEFTTRSWMLQPITGRIVAGLIEKEFLAGSVNLISRREIIDRVNTLVSELGLADAVPVSIES